MKLFPSIFLGMTLALAACSASGQIVSIGWGAQNTSGLGLADGTDLAVGSLLRLGTFSMSNSQILANQGNLSALDAAFVQYDTAHIGDDVGVAAHWNKLSIASTDALHIAGSRIYLWAFNGVSLLSATEHGIYTSSDPSWIFPSDASFPNVATIDLEQVTETVVGGFGLGTSDATHSPLYNLAAIPEPAETAALSAILSGVGVVWHRRRRRSR